MPLVPAGAAGGPVDAQAELESLAHRLRAAHEADPADAGVARVLKDVLMTLRGPAETVDGELARMFAAFPGRS